MINTTIVILDSAPGWDALSVNVLFYAREVLSPVSLEVMTLQGLSDFAQNLASIQRYHHRSATALRRSHVLRSAREEVRRDFHAIASVLSRASVFAHSLQRAFVGSARLRADDLRICAQAPSAQKIIPR